MDLSKLPKLSDTKAAEGEASPVGPVQTEPVPVQSVSRPTGYREPTTPPAPSMLGVDIWISTIMGLLFVFLGMQFGSFAIAKLTHQTFHTHVVWTDDDHPSDTEVPYFELTGYTAWTEMGEFLFGLSLLLEAASKAAVVLRPGTASRSLLMLATLITVAAIVLNVITCGLLLHVGLAPLFSAIAVAFGGWIFFDEWTTLKATRARPAKLVA